MKDMKTQLLLMVLASALTQGCVYHYPVNRRENVKPVLGKTVASTRPLYLAKDASDYLILPHDGVYDAPSLEEFEAGKWEYGYWRHRFNFKEIIPSNTHFTITTVWEEFNMEVGPSYLVYGRFEGTYPGIKPKKVLLWNTMSDDLLNNRDAEHFLEVRAQQDLGPVSPEDYQGQPLK